MSCHYEADKFYSKSDNMSLFEISETAFEHIQATGELDRFLEDLTRAPTKNTVVPPAMGEGELYNFV